MLSAAEILTREVCPENPLKFEYESTAEATALHALWETARDRALAQHVPTEDAADLHAVNGCSANHHSGAVVVQNVGSLTGKRVVGFSAPTVSPTAAHMSVSTGTSAASTSVALAAGSGGTDDDDPDEPFFGSMDAKILNNQGAWG